MAIPMNTTLTLSCEVPEEESGPIIVHSTGVPGYRISPDVIQILQETLTNDRLCDHEMGVQCSDSAQVVLGVFTNAGFEVISEHGAGERKLWTIIKSS